MDPLNFFKQIYGFIDGVDVQLHLKRVGPNITVCVVPESSKLVDYTQVSGTPDELDNEFLPTIWKPIQDSKGLNVVIKKKPATVDDENEDTDSVEKTATKAKPVKTKKPAPAKAKPKKNDKKKAEAPPKPTPPVANLFPEEI